MENTKLNKTEDIVSDAPVRGKDLPAEGKKEDTITLTRRQLRDLVQEEVQKGLMGGVKPMKRVKDHTATLRFYKDKPVVWYGNIRQTQDTVTGEPVGWMDIKLFGEKEAVKVNYLQFLNNEGEYQNQSYTVQIKEQKATEKVESQGRWRTENPDEANLWGKGKNFESQDVDLEVVSYEYESDVEVIEGPFKGKPFHLPNTCLNQ